jgi:signal transduction histidine kinase
MPDNDKSKSKEPTTKKDTNMKRQLADMERLATIGKLASKVAHELNSPLDGILRYINLAIRALEKENLEKPKEYLAQCRQGLMRMVQIVSELLEFSRSTYALSEEPVKIEQVIDDAINAIETDMEISNIRILRAYNSQMPQVRNGNLFQVFCNLLRNAIDAMPDGGELNVTTRLEKDDTIAVEFHDSGTGFVPEDAEAIFEPFYTTKARGKGTGLGLAICRDIIERYNGRITAQNSPEGGSIFTVYIPTEINS